MRCIVLAGFLVLAATLCGCYMTMARDTPELQGRLLDHGKPAASARLYIVRSDRPGHCSQVPRDAPAFQGGSFDLSETRRPEWVYPEPRYDAWTLCIAYRGRTYVGYSMAKLDYPPPQLNLSCELSVQPRLQTEHAAEVYGLCRRT